MIFLLAHAEQSIPPKGLEGLFSVLESFLISAGRLLGTPGRGLPQTAQ